MTAKKPCKFFLFLYAQCMMYFQTLRLFVHKGVSLLLNLIIFAFKPNWKNNIWVSFARTGIFTDFCLSLSLLSGPFDLTT